MGQRLADQVAAVGGSWGFIAGFGVFLAAWVALNALLLVEHSFDPYPFVFLNLLLSMLAALQAPIIMMSQNRQAAKDRLAAALDYEVNVKAEISIAQLHDKIDHLQERLQSLLSEIENEAGRGGRGVIKSPTHLGRPQWATKALTADGRSLSTAFATEAAWAELPRPAALRNPNPSLPCRRRRRC